MIEKMYGFEVGKVYKTRMPVEDERGTVYPAGVSLRIVAITPKVRIVTGFRNKDSKQYFYNAEFDHLPFVRVREDFCTLSKPRTKTERGQGAIGLLIVLAIVAVLLYVIFGHGIMPMINNLLAQLGGL